MLAFATIVYVGIFLIGLGTLNEDGVAGAALFVVSDGANKAALFGAVGILQHRKAGKPAASASAPPTAAIPSTDHSHVVAGVAGAAQPPL